MDRAIEPAGALETAPVLDEDPRQDRGVDRTWRVLRRDPAAWIGTVLALLVIGLAVLAPVISPHDPEHQYRKLMPLDGSALPPSAMFPLGTDVLGRDYLSRLLHAGRATLVVGLGADLAAVLVGSMVGLIAGYAGSVRFRVRGRELTLPLETTLMRIADIGLAFPALLLAIALTAVFHPSLELVALVIASVLWASSARLVHARTRAVCRAEFVTAAEALGCGTWRIMRRHLLPHLMPLVIVLLAAGVAVTVLFEATLSYLGAGAPSSAPTWGRMLADGAGYYTTDLRLPLLPGVAIFVTVLAFTLLGDALRDALDPHAWRR